jgi:oligopeptide transport system ATP-binding protein
LLKSIPSLQEKGTTLYTIGGMPPDLSKPIPGCAFAPRRPADKRALCSVQQQPQLVEVSPRHWAQNCPGCLEEAG